MRNFAACAILAIASAFVAIATATANPPTYSAPTVVTTPPTIVNTVFQAPVAVPVIVPAAVFQYLPAVGVPSTVPAQPASLPAQVSQPAPAHPQMTMDQIDALVRARVEAILSERATREERAPREGIDYNPTGELPIARMPLDYSPNASLPQARTQDFTAAAMGILNQRCAACHTGQGSKGRFVMFAQTNQPALMTAAQKERILFRVREATMPLAAAGNRNSPAACTPQEIAVLERWVHPAASAGAEKRSRPDNSVRMSYALADMDRRESTSPITVASLNKPTGSSR